MPITEYGWPASHPANAAEAATAVQAPAQPAEAVILMPRAQLRESPQTGGVWSGRGPKPKWLAVAIGNGAALADFEGQS